MSEHESAQESKVRSPAPSHLGLTTDDSDRDVVPDGGRVAWLVVFGGFLLSFSTIGYAAAWGSFQAYYENTLLQSSSSSSIAWIGASQQCLILLPGLLTGRIFDLGYFRASLVGSTLLYTAANFLLAQCQIYWHFLLCQGIAFGVAMGWIYIPCLAMLSQWFQVKRPLAYGIISLGASLGGIFFPVAFRALVPQIGFPWTIRTFAFINTGMFAVANLTLKTRTCGSGVAKQLSKESLAGLLSGGYIVYVLATFLCFLGLYTPLTFATLSAEAIGVPQSLAFYLPAIMNAASTVGRFGGSVLAVRYGPMNVIGIATVLAAVFACSWPFAHSQRSLIALLSLYGVFSGPFIGLFPAPVAQMGAPRDTGLRTGIQMTALAIGGLAGPPVSGALIRHPGDFVRTGAFAGTVILASALTMTASKSLILRRIVGKL